MADPLAIDLEHVEEILPRYSVEGPRYTSYPTAPVWSEGYGATDFAADLAGARAAAGAGLSLYVHVPFCRSLCHFCACNKVITRNPELPERYLDSLAREVETVRAATGPLPAATQQHWGGGTPTYLVPAQLRRLASLVAGAFPLAPDAEVSVEVDPRVTSTEQVDALRESGFNRISMGVQDFDARVQQAIHRIQPVAETAALVERAREAGFQSVNFDLIYGLPYQSEASFGHTLDTVLALGPDRIALYSYAHVTWLAKQQRGFDRKDLPAPETKLRILLLALRRLLAAGYRHVGMDHFAKPEDELSQALDDQTLRRNFMGYTTQAGSLLLGFGPSAISELEGSYAQSQRGLEAWHTAVDRGGLATLRGHRLSRDDRERRFVIGRLMCHGELRAEEFEASFGRPFAAAYAPELAALEPARRDGLVECRADGSLRVTPLGRLLVRNAAMAFDAYLPAQQQSGRPMFSRTV